ncbi:hypothetical protein BDV59DRAFT_204146 [Aspergillus ambiguus]|uniref:SDR family NAD(P)-dependent oxidoreductase n=1 Tax=Aspergillus ambiguus TaxID=176160 RepID=UPI003CCD6198
MHNLLRGVGFITGAASGIGKATAFSFARHGVRQLGIADINISAAEKAAKALNSQFQGLQAIPIKIDVTDHVSIEDAVGQAVDKFGRIDYAVNNAGIGGPADLSTEHDIKDWQKTIDIDLNGVWMSSRAELQVMQQQEKLENSPRLNRGVIVNVASMYGIIATSLNVPVISYTAAKHGVIGLTKADALAYAPKGIRINAICPGYVATPLVLNSMPSEVRDREISKTPVGRMAQMDEVGDMITFLVSPMSSYMYGAALIGDGGFTIQ